VNLVVKNKPQRTQRNTEKMVIFVNLVVKNLTTKSTRKQKNIVAFVKSFVTLVVKKQTTKNAKKHGEDGDLCEPCSKKFNHEEHKETQKTLWPSWNPL
jgi:hypothetical protein